VAGNDLANRFEKSKGYRRSAMWRIQQPSGKGILWNKETNE